MMRDPSYGSSFFISYVISLFLFSRKYLRPEDSCTLGKCDQRITRQQGRNIYIAAPLLRLFQFHELLVRAASLCSRNELVSLLSI